jgi:hypothetical protein
MPASPTQHAETPQPAAGAAAEFADIALFRHCKRTRWGVAALLWERDGKRAYQFSDGKLRVFKQGFYHLFESAAPPGDGSAKAVRRLARLARADDLSEAAHLPTLRDQILLVRRRFPNGFAGDAWRKQYRGVGARKRLKRHRDPAISEAHQLSAERLDPLIASFAWPEIHARLVAVLQASNLVPATQLRKLEALAPSRELALALRGWVVAASGQLEIVACEPGEREHDDDAPVTNSEEAELERRFNHLVRLLGAAGTWPIVTAIAGLLAPTQHTCVRPSVYEVQGKMLLPNFQVGKHPRYPGYRQHLHVAQTVFDELEHAGLHPHDLLDVYDFVWETLRPAARYDLTHQYELPPVVAGADERAA